MINIDLQQLIHALDAPSKQDLESAAEGCVRRGGAKVSVEDLLLALLQRADGLLAKALLDADIEADELAAVLQLKTAAQETQSPVFSAELVQWLQDALLVGNLELGKVLIDEGALILAMLRNPMRYAGTRYQALIGQINVERFVDFLSCAHHTTHPDNRGEPNLARFAHDLTQKAREGKIDPVFCRDDEIRQMIDILARRRKNNPIVVGEAGVGKSAIVEGLALRIAHGQVPPALAGVKLLTLDLGLLQAGASMKGEFERRLQGVIDEAKHAAVPTILFIDEAHTLIGAGGQAGASDAANLLKPALARGELRTIAATTWSEYKKYFEKDPALSRRFQPVQLLQPTVSDAITILRGLAPIYEKEHGVYLRDDAVVAAAELAARYLTGRQLPDKAIDVLDTACARVRISLAAAPVAIEKLRSDIVVHERQHRALCRDRDAGVAIDGHACDDAAETLESLCRQHAELTARWEQQRTLAQRIVSLRIDVGAETEASRDERESLRTDLAALQQHDRLVSYEVCPRLIAEVISQWTGVPLSQLVREHNAKVLTFAAELRQRVHGQEQAVTALDQAMRAAATGLNRADAPLGVFLLVGPSGVGKTETALALADLLYGGERFLTVINMSEFQERHSVSRLIGAPPGYVGYGEGGMLTEAVRQKPYSVILLDEVEKADPDVMNVFYQIFDKGIANDGEGREIDFRNTLILMTSNLASDEITRRCGSGDRPLAADLEQAIRPALSRHFKPALLARMKVVPYYPVDGEVLEQLVRMKLHRFGDRLKTRGLAFQYSDRLVGTLVDRCNHTESGARVIDRLLEQLIQAQVVDRMLSAMATGETLDQVCATVDGDGGIVCEFA
ncbi:type VI secretion system ATPase TssH [Pseudomonas matsuisoli]|uniref:ClpA/B-type protease n=1 Tax=Pseudomonas matsuisoli TaxID=1515666 RepID=A0A917PRG1_9PSED|nr:type VI secretion system ATPase TssH [Pseudomonas matsuisoli]GGJ89208.1 ClpA/B-type protease [Pseudomonas matsuisoli]